MSSGGDLDGMSTPSCHQPQVVDLTHLSMLLGDEYFVCWDPRLVPKKISEVRILPLSVPSCLNSTLRSLIRIHPTKSLLKIRSLVKTLPGTLRPTTSKCLSNHELQLSHC